MYTPYSIFTHPEALILLHDFCGYLCLSGDCLPMRLLNKSATKDKTGISDATIYRLIARGMFPEPVSIAGTTRVGWVESELDSWCADQVAQSRQAGSSY